MAELVFHIGTHKTGTTFLQNSLRLNVDRIRAAGWGYPDFLPGSNHLRFVLPFSERRAERLEQQHGVADRGASLEELDELLARHVQPGHRWIVSSEYASSMLGERGLAEMLAFLRRHFQRISLLVYLRRQEFVLPSGYAQNILSGRTYEWDSELIDLRRPWLDLRGNHRLWAAAAGAEGVIARPYLERYKRDPHQLLADFVRSAGLPGEDWRPAPRDQANVSLSAEGVLLLRALNAYLASEPRDRHARTVVKALQGLTRGPGLRVSPEMAAALRDGYAADNAALVDAVGADAEWQEWLEQPVVPATEEELTVAPDRGVELARALAAPDGPIDWSRSDLKPVPGRPLRVVSTVRAVVQRGVRAVRGAR